MNPYEIRCEAERIISEDRVPTDVLAELIRDFGGLVVGGLVGELREQARPHIQRLTKLRPRVEGTPPSEPLDNDVMRWVTESSRALRGVNRRVEAAFETEPSNELRELQAELQAWRRWLETEDFPSTW